MSDMIAVYRYTYWDEEAKAHKTSTRYATLETIRSGLGQPIPESVIKIRRDVLSDSGLYTPLIQGQGEP